LELSENWINTLSDNNQLPIGPILRALCQAAEAGPELLYEVMLKLTLVVEATAPMYGLSIWSFESGSSPHLQWVEGLQAEEISAAEQELLRVLSEESEWPKVKSGEIGRAHV